MEVKNFNCDLVFQNRFAGFGHLNRDVERFSSRFTQILWNLLAREREGDFSDLPVLRPVSQKKELGRGF